MQAIISPQDYQRLFEGAPGAMLVLLPDAGFTIAAVSDAYLRATMTRRQDILGRGVFEALTDDPARPEATGVRNLHDSLGRVVATGLPDRMPVQRYDIRRPDGTFEERHWSPLNLPVLGADGRVEAIIHHVEDVTGFVDRKLDALLARALGQRPREARLADPGLTGHDHHAPRRARLRDRRLQGLPLAVTLEKLHTGDLR